MATDLVADALSAVALQQEQQHTVMTVEEIVRTVLSVVPDVTDPSGDGREALRKAWEQGAKAGHHSPLTWFALRQVNPYASAPDPEAAAPQRCPTCGLPSDEWVGADDCPRHGKHLAAAPQDEVERLRAEVDNWRLAQKATLTANRRLAARLAAAEGALRDERGRIVADLRAFAGSSRSAWAEGVRDAAARAALGLEAQSDG